MQLNDLIKELNTTEISGDLNVEITSVEYDSRKVTKGSLFVAVDGFATDGHKYIESAIKNGAVAVIMQKKCDCSVPYVVTDNTRKALALISNAFYDYPTKKLKLIGVTGTNGKTTVTYLVKSVLEFAGHKVGLIGTNQNMIGDRVIETERTTPESLELCKLFSEMVEDGCDYAIMEVRVPDDWVGNTLMGLNVRRRYGLNILAIHRQGSFMVSPAPDLPLEAEDTLLVMGRKEDVERLES